MMGVDGTVMGRTKTLWVEIGCYDGCRWDVMVEPRHCGGDRML